MIKEFIERWTNHGDEKSDTQKFWLEFLRDVLDIVDILPMPKGRGF